MVSKDWIDKRMRGIAIRQSLTDEWKKRGLNTQRDFAILTTEISQNEKPDSIVKHKKVAKRGGKVAGDAREQTEKEIGRPVITKHNYRPRVNNHKELS